MAQISMGEMLEKQLAESQEGMKVHMKQEVGQVNVIVETLKNTTIPESMRQIDEQLERATEKQKAKLEECLQSVSDSIK